MLCEIEGQTTAGPKSGCNGDNTSARGAVSTSRVWRSFNRRFEGPCGLPSLSRAQFAAPRHRARGEFQPCPRSQAPRPPSKPNTGRNSRSASTTTPTPDASYPGRRPLTPRAARPRRLRRPSPCRPHRSIQPHLPCRSGLPRCHARAYSCSSISSTTPIAFRHSRSTIALSRSFAFGCPENQPPLNSATSAT